MRSLALLPLFVLVTACGAPEAGDAAAEESGAAVTTPDPEGQRPGASAAAPEGDAPSCGTGARLDDLAMLARAPQGGAAVFTLAGKTRTTTRTCTGETCVSDLAGAQAAADLVLTRAPDGNGWRGQLSPSAATTLTVEVTKDGATSGELVTFGEAPGSARLEASATTACFSARATVVVARDEGKRVETTVWFFAETPAEAPRVPVEEQPPLPSCDEVAPAASTYGLVPSGTLSTQSATVMEQYRDCRAATGCAPWQTGPVAADGSSPWASAPGTAPPSLAASGTLSNFGRGIVQTIARSSTGAQASFVGAATTYGTTVPLLGRGAQVDVKLTNAAMVLRESGPAKDEAGDPRVRTRRFACLPYAR